MKTAKKTSLTGQSGKRANLENPNTNLADADEWGESLATSAGVTVTPQKAMKLAAFWQAVNLISGDIAKLPLEVFGRDGKDRQVDQYHPAQWIVRWQANEDQTAFDFWQDFLCHLLVWRNAYAKIVRDANGRPRELIPLLPDRTNAEKIAGKKWYITEVNGKLYPLDPWDVLHVRGPSFNCQSGLGLIDFAKEVIGKALARQRHQSKFFRNGGRIGGLLTLPPDMPKPIKDKVEGEFRKNYEGGDAAFRTMVLRDGAKFQAAQSSFRDAQMLEVGQEDVAEVARLFNLPPHKLGNNKSTSYGSLEQENRAYYDSTLSSWMANIKQALWMRLLSKTCRNDGCHFFDYNVGALLWADVSTVAQIGNQGILSSWLTPNEVRRWFNLNGLPGGDQRLIPVNMQAEGTDPDSEDDNQTGPAVTSVGDGRSVRSDCRVCSEEWFTERTVPRLTAETKPAVDISAALKVLADDAGSRFMKRLKVAAARESKTAAEWAAFVENGVVEKHLPTGREMFKPLVQARELAGVEAGDPAAEILARFVEAAKALSLPVEAKAIDLLEI